MKFFSAFSGYGGFDIPLIKYGCECVGFAEIDKHAIANYKYNFKGVKNYGDVAKINWDDVPNFDILTGGFPCQDLSVAGKRKGLSGRRSGLFFEVIEILERKKPSYFIIENVKGMFNSNRGRDFLIVLDELSRAGYDIQWQVLNAKDFGIPQNRERVFIVGHLRGQSRPEIFPIARESKNFEIKRIGTIEGIKGHDILKRCYSFDGIAPALNTCEGGSHESKFLVTNDHGELRETKHVLNIDANYWKGMDKHAQRTQVVEVAPVLTPDRIEKRQNGRRFKEAGDEMFTLTAQDQHGIMIDNYKIRRLTPLECERLMGLPDDWTKYGIDDEEKIIEISDTQRYRLCGNGVVTNVVDEIIKRLIQGEKVNPQEEKELNKEIDKYKKTPLF